MLTLPIPAPKTLSHLVLDFNGTLAIDGHLQKGVGPRLKELAGTLRVHVVTADTFGGAREALTGLPVDIQIVGPPGEGAAKRKIVEELGAETVVCVGNGSNDCLMMEAAALAIVVLQAEGASPKTLIAADIVVPSIQDALDLLLRPMRIMATLRA